MATLNKNIPIDYDGLNIEVNVQLNIVGKVGLLIMKFGARIMSISALKLKINEN
jgi:hypothetical protein